MNEKRENGNFEEIFLRLQEAIGVKNISQLSEIIERKQPTVSAAKAKNNFPANWAFEIEKKYGILTGWIMTGKGPKTLDEQKGDLVFYEELEEWARETGRTENTQWLKNQIESFFPMFTEWKKRRAEGDIIEDGTPASKVA
ncbi:MAG: helix-turn-helix domain-containing protein [Desulfobulbus sp.]|nr:helix-turn-helix domain-containing protein [Desulfobulbus sp.]